MFDIISGPGKYVLVMAISNNNIIFRLILPCIASMDLIDINQSTFKVHADLRHHTLDGFT
jgi:hypothetical protein